MESMLKSPWGLRYDVGIDPDSIPKSVRLLKAGIILLKAHMLVRRTLGSLFPIYYFPAKHIGL